MNSHVLYLALGTYRVRAAREQVKELASSGATVSLVALDAPEWHETLEELDKLDGVEVVRVAPDKDGSAWGSAKKLAAAKAGPFARADVLVAGDAQALPVAWIAKRRRPSLDLRLEPHGGGREVEPADLAVLTPWYPSPNNPYAGTFVQAATQAVGGHFDRVTVFHTEDWSGPASAPLTDAVRVTTERLVEQGVLGHVLDSPEATVVRVPVPLIRRKNYAPWVEEQAKALASALPTGRIEAPVVHAHTGIYGGVLALRLARPDARVVVTEHSSFLDKVFAQPKAEELYSAVLERADAFMCVSSGLRDQIIQRFPQHADKIGVVPNAIPLDRFVLGPDRSPELLRWLYVGRLLKQKGVQELLDAFAIVAAEEPRATLTMVGHGPLEEELRERGAELALGERFRVLPPVAPEAVGPLMHEHDLLVHASKQETFGMTVVEAIASGLPVLVTRCGGPEATLAGIESAAGALMDVSDDPQVIVEAYRHLRENAGNLDLVRARQSLEGRMGYEAVGKQLVEVYEGALPPVPAPPAAAREEGAGPAGDTAGGTSPARRDGGLAGRAVVLALTPAKPRRIVSFANDLVAKGVEVTIVTAQPSMMWGKLGLDSTVSVLSIEEAEKKLRIPRAERLLVYRAPQAVLRRARRIAAKNRGAIGPELAVASVQRAHNKVANAWHKKVFNRGYKEVRPQLLARIAKRRVLPELSLDQVDHVFVSDINSTVTGWKWAKRHPHLKVTTNLDSSVYSAG
ncbi:glycosyltransferase family 4 protein [Streptomyces antibioticus]|uniref:glycosyltransferase family 4 protein n=1 Tax=Streptomyces antibioticus TaxID=1890 RepID=UPI00225B38E3|nr:glycosyltransferase family 4 protein [Streptomyces antibioticus]MCX4739197.1 glycosyltransferase family 4 protein [Streptomyces antibioticus]